MKWKIMIIDNITYHNPHAPTVLHNILLAFNGILSMPLINKVSLGIYTDPFMVGSFLGPPFSRIPLLYAPLLTVPHHPLTLRPLLLPHR